MYTPLRVSVRIKVRVMVRVSVRVRVRVKLRVWVRVMVRVMVMFRLTFTEVEDRAGGGQLVDVNSIHADVVHESTDNLWVVAVVVEGHQGDASGYPDSDSVSPYGD